MNEPLVQKWAYVLWPSFLVAAAATIIYFALFDPVDLDIFGIHVPGNRTAAYTIGFFAFWFLGAASSAFTMFLQRPAAEVNGFCPPEAAERPLGSMPGAAGISGTPESGRTP